MSSKLETLDHASESTLLRVTALPGVHEFCFFIRSPPHEFGGRDRSFSAALAQYRSEKFSGSTSSTTCNLDCSFKLLSQLEILLVVRDWNGLSLYQYDKLARYLTL